MKKILITAACVTGITGIAAVITIMIRRVRTAGKIKK